VLTHVVAAFYAGARRTSEGTAGEGLVNVRCLIAVH
jgi:hypothetical protein